MNLRIGLVEPTPAIWNALLEKLTNFNGQQESNNNFSNIVIGFFADDELIGGLWGEALYGHFRIDILYVPSAVRAAGWGRRILQAAEHTASARSCHVAWLTTYSFQARPFYEKRGYSLFGEVGSDPILYFFQKNLQLDRVAEKQ